MKELSSPAVVEWVHNVENDTATVVLMRIVVVRDKFAPSDAVGWIPNVGDEKETTVKLVREVVVEDKLRITVVSLLIAIVGVESMEMSSIVLDGPAEEEVQCFCESF